MCKGPADQTGNPTAFKGTNLNVTRRSSSHQPICDGKALKVMTSLCTSAEQKVRDKPALNTGNLSLWETLEILLCGNQSKSGWPCCFPFSGRCKAAFLLRVGGKCCNAVAGQSVFCFYKVEVTSPAGPALQAGTPRPSGNLSPALRSGVGVGKVWGHQCSWSWEKITKQGREVPG